MKKGILPALLALGAGCAIMLNSCSEKDILTQDSNLMVAATEESQVASIGDDVINTVDEYVSSLSQTGFKSSAKPMKTSGVSSGSSISVVVDWPDSTSYPKVITINFGTSGTSTSKRSNVYKGVLIVTINNKLSLTDSYYTIRTQNFYVNDNKIGLLRTVTYKGINSSSHLYWTIVANDTITKTNNAKITCHSERTREQLSNNSTPYLPWDDTYAIRGTADGINTQGSTYQMAIDTNNPLIVAGTCPYIEKGSAAITVNGKAAVIDYGDGTCDNTATVTANNITKTITLSN